MGSKIIQLSILLQHLNRFSMASNLNFNSRRFALVSKASSTNNWSRWKRSPWTCSTVICTQSIHLRLSGWSWIMMTHIWNAIQWFILLQWTTFLLVCRICTRGVMNMFFTKINWKKQGEHRQHALHWHLSHSNTFPCILSANEKIREFLKFYTWTSWILNESHM
jgi:hypothetical protein